LFKSVERFGRSRFGFGGVDPRVLFIPSCPGHTGLTSALDRSDRCVSLVGFASSECLSVCCCLMLLLFRVGGQFGAR
jgi:hypothetical protein